MEEQVPTKYGLTFPPGGNELRLQKNEEKELFLKRTETVYQGGSLRFFLFFSLIHTPLPE